MNKDEVRRLFPQCASFADECRRVFGDGVKLVHASESGREIGIKPHIDADRVVRLSDMCIDSRPFSDVVEDRKGKRAK